MNMRLLVRAAITVMLFTSIGNADVFAKQAIAGRTDRQRGAVVSVEPVAAMETAELQRIAADFPGHIVVRNGARLFRVVYWTVLKGRATRASGLLSLPDRPAPPKGLVLFLHGTNATRALAPSQPDRVDGNEETAVFAGNGYLVALPDYIGLGASQVPHPYLIVQPQVDATVDLLRAIQRASKGLGLRPTPDLFMMGFSQGGQVVAAVHRRLEQQPLPGYRLRGSVGIAGPYDLRETSLPKAIENNCRLCVGYLTWATYAYSTYYGHPLGEALQPRYVGIVPGLFDGTHTAQEIGAALPDDPAAMFRPNFLRAMRTRGDNWFTQALALNETYAWAPVAPFRIYFGDRDVDVPPAASRAFFAYARAHRGNVTLHSLAGADHQASGAMAYAPVLAWFDAMTGHR
jgi:Serine aminopeptidase, S33